MNVEKLHKFSVYIQTVWGKTMYMIENKENIDLDTLQGELEKEYGPAVAQDIIDRIRKNDQGAKAPEYMDVKAMSEMAERFRAQAMMAVWRLKDWRGKQDRKVCQQNLIELEGAYLERQCQDAVRLYRQANSAYFGMYREAMAAFAPKTDYPAYKQIEKRA